MSQYLRASAASVSFGLHEDNAAEAISEVRAIVHNLRRLPGKARREGDNSPEVWVLLGREIHRLEVLAQKLATKASPSLPESDRADIRGAGLGNDVPNQSDEAGERQT